MASAVAFQANDWRAVDGTDQDGNGRPELVVQVYGRDAKGRSVCVGLTGYRPRFYVCAADADAEEVKHVRVKIAATCTEIQATSMWGFRNGEKSTFLKLEFVSMKAFRDSAKRLHGAGIQTFESNVDAALQLMHLRGVEPCGWVKVTKCLPNGGAGAAPATRCDLDLVASYARLGPHANDGGLSAPLVVASFDIECAALNVGRFPMASKPNYQSTAVGILDRCALLTQQSRTRAGACGQISAMIREALAPTSDVAVRRRANPVFRDVTGGVLYLDSKPDKVPYIYCEKSPSDRAVEEVAAQCADVVARHMFESKAGGITYEQALSEITHALDSRMPKQIGDPVIQIGTTVHRNGEHECCERYVLTLGECGPIDGVTVMDQLGSEIELLTAWAELIGRLQPDVLTGYNVFGFDWPYIRSRCMELGIEPEFAMALTRLKDPKRGCRFVCKELSSSAMGENILQYYDIPGTVPVDIMKVVMRDHRLPSYSLDEVSHHFLSQRKLDVKPHEIVAMFCDADPAQRTKVAEYCVQDCVLCNVLAIKLQLVPNSQGMANVCTVPLSYIFMRGQGIKIFSLVVRKARERGFVIPTLARHSDADVPDTAEDDVGYEGAMVLPPKIGVYETPVVVCDYSSLYPSCMISENLSHDTIVLDPAFDGLPGVEYNDVTYTDNSGADRTCRFACNRPGILPEILGELVSMRKATRRRAEAAEDAFQKAVLDGLQLAYKVTANSLYGQMGAVTSPLYMRDIAACTTATGRLMLGKAKAFMEERHGADVIYGDSDSIFCVFPDPRPEEGTKPRLRRAIATAVEAVAQFKKLIKPPHDLTYEKTFVPFILLGKKKYTGMLYEEDADAEGKSKSMGIVLKRRDNANIVKTVYGGIIDILMRDMDADAAVRFIDECTGKLLRGEYDMRKELVVTKALRGVYKNPKAIAHKVLADRMAARDPGNAPAIGERIQFVYVVNDKALLQGDRVEHPDYVEKHRRDVKVDYEYYITNEIMNPVAQIMSLVLERISPCARSVVRPEHWQAERRKIERTLGASNREAVDRRLQTAREKYTGNLLFGDALMRAKNRRQNQSEIRQFFTKPAAPRDPYFLRSTVKKDEKPQDDSGDE